MNKPTPLINLATNQAPATAESRPLFWFIRILPSTYSGQVFLKTLVENMHMFFFSKGWVVGVTGCKKVVGVTGCA